MRFPPGGIVTSGSIWADGPDEATESVTVPGKSMLRRTRTGTSVAAHDPSRKSGPPTTEISKFVRTTNDVVDERGSGATAAFPSGSAVTVNSTGLSKAATSSWAVSRIVVVFPIPVIGFGRNCAVTPAGSPETDIDAGPFDPFSRVTPMGMSRVDPCRRLLTCAGAETLTSGSELSGNSRVRSSKPSAEFAAPGPVTVR